MTTTPLHSHRTTFGFPTWETPPACLQHQLLEFADRDTWTIADAIEGTQIFGATGSGKTSGSGQALARAFIRAGFGGLVLTVKPDDLQTWIRYLRGCGLGDESLRDRVVVVEPEGVPPPGAIWPRAMVGGREVAAPLDLPRVHAFNFLSHETAAGVGTQDIVSLFLNSLSPSGSAVSRVDPYWDEALRELLTHAVDLAKWGSGASDAVGTIRLADLVAIIRSAPQSIADARSAAWRNPKTSRCWEMLLHLNEAVAKPGRISAAAAADLAQTVSYWLNDFPALNERTRTIITSSFTAKAVGLLRHPLRELLCGAAGDGAGAPSATHRGKIVILNIPVKLYGEVGRFAQIIWKTVWQRATERRISDLQSDWPRQRPVFLWADEAQYFVTKQDALFQQTARSTISATVYLTQSISNYYAFMGSDAAGPSADSLLGNLQTKIFHANGDPATNEWAERLFARARRGKRGVSISDTHSFSLQQEFESVVWPKRFTTLAKGGPSTNHIVEAFVFQAGRAWKSGAPDLDKDPSNVCKCLFSQLPSV